MKLSKHIKLCIDLLAKHGDIKLLYTAADAEGNGYTRVTYGPEIRYLMPHENQHSPEDLIQEKEDDQTIEQWIEDVGLDEEDIPKLKKVVLI